MSKTEKYSTEVREHAVRLVQEARKDYPSPWSAVESVVPKVGGAAACDGGIIGTGRVEWGTWFNRPRLLEPIRDFPPAEAGS